MAFFRYTAVLLVLCVLARGSRLPDVARDEFAVSAVTQEAPLPVVLWHGVCDCPTWCGVVLLGDQVLCGQPTAFHTSM